MKNNKIQKVAGLTFGWLTVLKEEEITYDRF